MNSMNFLRLVSRRTIFNGYHNQHSRLVPQLARRTMSASLSSQKMKEKEVFRDALPGIIDNLMLSPRIRQLPEAASWIKKILEHNITGGKHARGFMTMFAYEMLEKPEYITEENIKLSKVLGWCLEMLQSYFCILDDVMDESTTRRGMPCWHLVPGVGMGALNDSVLISCCINETLEAYFKDNQQLLRIIKLFHETILLTSMGQHIDFQTAQETKKGYSLMTIERYESIVTYKTCFYTFRLPVLLGLTLVKEVDESIYPAIDDISIKLGILFQIQDDYIDCFGDEKITGKVGTDIQEGKCSWLAATALAKCNSEQRELFTQNYGSKDPEHVAQIKKLYAELNIPDLYKQKEVELHDDIVRRVQALPSDTAPSYFFKLLDNIYQRNR